MRELWKAVIDFPAYQVSNLGRVKRQDGKLKKLMLAGPGYYMVSLRKDGINKTCYVHHLVAEAFIGKRESELVTHHKDGNKQNNKASNLERYGVYIMIMVYLGL